MKIKVKSKILKKIKIKMGKSRTKKEQIKRKYYVNKIM